MRSRQGALLLAAAVLFSGCRLFFFPDLSGIVTSPSRQGQVLEPGEPIFISFDFAVDRYSVEKLFAVEGSEGKVSGRISWEGNRLTFIPEPELVYGSRYIVSCRGEILDCRANPYPLDIEILFYYCSDRELPPVVLSLTPMDGGIVSGTDTLAIRFSKPMNRHSFEDGFSLSPDTEHRLTWNPEGTEVTIAALEEWENLQLYRMALGKKIEDTLGIPLAREIETTFSVETDCLAPKVLEVLPAVNDWVLLFPPTGEQLDGIAYKDAIRIVFSEPMNEQSTEESFELVPDESGELEWIDAQTLVFIPEMGYSMATAYTLAIRSSAQDSHGNAMARDSIYRFTTDRNIPVLELSSIHAIKDTTILITPPYGTAVAVDLDGGGGIPDYAYEFVFSFSEGFPTGEEQYRVQSAISITAAFGMDSSPRAIGHSWLSAGVLSVTFRGFTSEAGAEHYYLLEIPGGPDGVRNNRGSHFTKDVQLLLRTRE